MKKQNKKGLGEKFSYFLDCIYVIIEHFVLFFSFHVFCKILKSDVDVQVFGGTFPKLSQL